MRRRLPLILVAIAALALASPAQGAWQASGGSGSGYGKARALPAGNTPGASVSNRNVTVSWTAPSSTVPIDGYIVRRFDTGGTEYTVGANCSGTISALSCTETGVASGSWRYTVTPVRQNWRGAQSAQSTAVTVSSPSLTLNTTSFTVLRATTSGQIQNFKDGQTVTYRLDNATTGTLLEGSITPSTVPASGTATVSVTIPSGIANGSHVVYAVGNNGDQASANITVNTGSGFFATGGYGGNGSDNRAISGLGFNPQVVIVKSVAAQIAVIRTDTMSGDNSKSMTGATALIADRIQSLDADGFTIGTNAQVNTAGTQYRWMAFRANPGVLTTGTYKGNGTSQSATGFGFSPEQVGVFGAGANTPYQRFSGAARSFTYGADTGITTGITSLDASGFSVGSSADLNTSGNAYHYVAFNEVPGLVKVGSYTGNGVDNRNVTGTGLTPAYVQLHANDTVTGRDGVHRASSMTGDDSFRFNAASTTNMIQALQGDGFQVGTNAVVNNNTTAYNYLALKNGTPSTSCASPGSTTVAPTADAYVDQALPIVNNGTGTDLFVRSGALLANRRALLKFTLPTIPAGCSLSQATLNLFATAATTGRTIDVYRAGSSWTETGVTWNNAPATAGTASSAASATGALSWDVSSQTGVLYAPGPDNGFIVRDSVEGAATLPQQTYQAREGATNSQDPSLYVAWN